MRSQKFRQPVFRSLLIFLLGMISFSLVGCGPSAPPPSEEPAAPAAASTWKKPTEAEANEFGAAFEKAMFERDIASVNKMIDWDSLLESAVSGIPTDKELRRGFIKGAKGSLDNESGMFGTIAQQLGENGSIKLLRVREKDGRRTALFRLLVSDDGVNYIEMILAKKPSEKVEAVDVYMFSSSETLSKTFRRTYLPLAVGQSRGVFESLTQKEKDFADSLPIFERFMTAVGEQNFAKILKIYEEFPKSLQEDKMILLVRLRGALETADESLCIQTIDRFRGLYPKDPCIDLILITRYTLSEEYDKAKVCIARLDELVGGDPYLKVLKAGCDLMEEKYSEAKKSYEDAIAEEPSLIDAYWGLITATLQMKDFAATTQALIRTEEAFDIEWEDLTEVEGYEEYVKSPEYQEWLNR